MFPVNKKIIENQKGMTLVEILAVIVIIGLILGVVARGVIGKSDAAKAQLNVVKMEKVKQYLSQYKLQYNTYPSSLQGLVKAESDLSKSGQLFTPLAEESELKDVWGSPYLYKTENNNRSFELSSLGADGIAGGEGTNSDVTVRP